ncbi:MAG: YicC family protein [Desulfobacterales bacterium]|nr:MAG: YicC family protein [Desulfobacterales bacterium]
MTLKSMTGYGRGEITANGRNWTVEIRSVNNRFLDAKIRIPRDYSVFEDDIRNRIAACYQRGRVDLSLSVSGDFSDLMEVRVDYDLAGAYKASLEKMAEKLDLHCTLAITDLVAYPDVLVREQKKEDLDMVSVYIGDAVDMALEECLKMREKEGRELTLDLRERLVSFSCVIDDIEKRIPKLVESRKQSLQERLDNLLDKDLTIDPMRLAQEVAILADKSDVTEELVRIRSHVLQFEDILQTTGEAVGRKLDFLIQEFLREVNTMASKINDAHIAHMTVELKSELEKMREQIQNIE